LRNAPLNVIDIPMMEELAEALADIETPFGRFGHSA